MDPAIPLLGTYCGFSLHEIFHNKRKKKDRIPFALSILQNRAQVPQLSAVFSPLSQPRANLYPQLISCTHSSSTHSADALYLHSRLRPLTFPTYIPMSFSQLTWLPPRHTPVRLLAPGLVFILQDPVLLHHPSVCCYGPSVKAA